MQYWVENWEEKKSAYCNYLKIRLLPQALGVRCGARTHDTQNHNLVLYQLN